ncbi:hypothetical protein EJB05_35233, partial [Eragrostis curvula]
MSPAFVERGQGRRAPVSPPKMVEHSPSSPVTGGGSTIRRRRRPGGGERRLEPRPGEEIVDAVDRCRWEEERRPDPDLNCRLPDSVKRVERLSRRCSPLEPSGRVLPSDFPGPPRVCNRGWVRKAHGCGRFADNFLCCGKKICQYLWFIAEEPDFFLDTKQLEQENPEIPGNPIIFGPNFMTRRLYQLSSPEDLTLGLSLIQPANRFNDDTLMRDEKLLTEEGYGSARRVFVVVEDDLGIPAEFQRRRALASRSKRSPEQITWSCSRGHRSWLSSLSGSRTNAASD